MGQHQLNKRGPVDKCPLHRTSATNGSILLVRNAPKNKIVEIKLKKEFDTVSRLIQMRSINKKIDVFLAQRKKHLTKNSPKTERTSYF